ncbi:MAG TPA: CotH kinase family protein [Armatimonadota bacterium]|nr:CotH kinase family protein [Armatimonadota bacterium]
MKSATMPPVLPPMSPGRARIAAALLLASTLGGVPLAGVGAQGTPAAGATERKPKSAPGKASRKKDESIAFFRDGVVPRIKIQISEPELKQLRHSNREYVRCTVVENDKKTYENVAVKLKGSAGSFRGVDDRPALTLNFDKYTKDQEFHGLDKFHLNNSLQDPSYLNELLGSDLFLAAGIPAARITHARVWLNGRDLGFYVLKEGFGKDFLKRNSLDPKGNLYESVPGQDLDGAPQLDSGSGPSDRSDLKAVIAACREGDTSKRWQQLEQLVDVDRFLTFVAMELMTCHWDGYTQGRNNYRFYFNPKNGKLQFFPHGMDQLFGDPNFDVRGVRGTMLTQAVMSNPEWRDRYRDRVSALLKLFVPPDRLIKRVDEVHQRLRPVLAEMGADRAGQFDGQVKTVKDRLAARAKNLAQQSPVVQAQPKPAPPPAVAQAKPPAPQNAVVQAQPKAASPPAVGQAKPPAPQKAVVEPRPKPAAPPAVAQTKPPAPQNAVVEPGHLRFSPAGVAQITQWAPRLETTDARLEKQEGASGKPKAGALVVTAGPSGRCVASWRTKVILPAGKYRFEARARTQGVKANQEASGTGAGIRISGSTRTNKLDGTAKWTPLTHEIVIQAPSQQVELVAELRASAGQAFFDLGSLRLVKITQ